MRSTNLNGPEQTRCKPKFSPAASAALGDTIMPAPVASWASNGAKGADSKIFAVCSSITSTPAIARISLLRADPGIVRCRSILYFNAAASKGSPSWNLTFGRSLMTSPFLSSVHRHSMASCGTISSSGPMSNNRSHNALRTTKLAEVRLSVGSRVSGSEASPMRKVCAIAAPMTSIDPASQAAISVRPFIITVPPRSCFQRNPLRAVHCSLQL